MTWCPHITVATVVEDNGRFLLVEEHATEGLVYNQPAGHLDPNESLIQAAARETFEETGYKVDITGYCGVTLYTAPSNGVTYVRHTFTARVVEHVENATLDDGIVGTAWLSRDDVATCNRLRSPIVLTTIDQYLNHPTMPLSAIY
jgi:8-oxo-dGTP pyrophosphatase MutT (NUDIX family)